MIIEIYLPLSIHELGQRDNQEDALYPLEGKDSDRLFVLCDGMGGYENGEKASQTVCQSIGKWFEEHVISECPLTDDLLREAIEYAYTELDKLNDNDTSQMGTTLTLLFLHRHGVTAAHIGDSRIYHIRPYSSPKLGKSKREQNEGVLYQSRDHSVVFDLYQSGEITYEEMLTHPQKNVITRAMSPGEDIRVKADIIHITDIQPDDYFFLCSDGMLENLSNDELSSVLTAHIFDEEKREKLISATVDNHDNHTAWIIHIKNVVQEEGDKDLVNEEPTSRYNAINILPRHFEQELAIEDNEDDVVIKSVPKEKTLLKKIMNQLNIISKR